MLYKTSKYIMVVNYQNGKIYSIRTHQTDIVYIGSTTQELSVRMAGHRRNYRSHLRGKGDGSSSIEILKYEDSYIELIQKFPCVDKSELHRKEGEIIRLTDNAVNKRVAGRNIKEYRFDNKEVIAAGNKEYYKANKEVINEKYKEYYKSNKDIIIEKNKKYQEANKEVISEKKKEYYKANKEAIIEKDKEYYKANKEAILEKRKEYYKANRDKINEKIECELCKKMINQYHMLRHKTVSCASNMVKPKVKCTICSKEMSVRYLKETHSKKCI